MEPLCAAIRTYLSSVHGLASLRLQNHIYGCYLLLEDIVQHHVTLKGSRVNNQNVTFDLRDQFSEIGLRYGFAMDTQLLLHPCPTDYLDSWIHIFTTTTTLEEVDALEEAVNGLIERFVPAEDEFFISAKDGFLPPQWVDRALSLLLGTTVAPSVAPTVAPTVAPAVTPIEVKPSLAILEKHKDNPRRLFASTRRRKGIVHAPKKILGTTRRAIKSV
jgi:hypothetical protein